MSINITLDDPVRLSGLLDKPPADCAFRGERDAAWKLESTLERAAKAAYGNGFREHLSEFEKIQIDRFVRRCNDLKLGDIYAGGKLPDIRDTFEWLSLMQHYGHPTRLIDFTNDIAVALHFALRGPPTLPFAVYALQMIRADDDDAGNKLPKDDKNRPYRILGAVNINELVGRRIACEQLQPAIVGNQLGDEWKSPKQNYGWDKPFIQHPRIDRQAGRFLYQLNIDGDVEAIPALTKYIIPGEHRQFATDWLRSNWPQCTKEYLFPGFDQDSMFPKN
jgi:hypothetical protein